MKTDWGRENCKPVWLSMPKSQQSWVRSQHPPTQWNLNKIPPFNYFVLSCRLFVGTALVCLHNLRKTFKYGGRKMAPSIEEITAISAGRNSKRQIYRLPGHLTSLFILHCFLTNKTAACFAFLAFLSFFDFAFRPEFFSFVYQALFVLIVLFSLF